MQPIAKTNYSESFRYDPIAEWKLLPDELVLEIFSHLNILERVHTLRTSHQFNTLGKDRYAMKHEMVACQGLVRRFVDKNPASQISKNLEVNNLDWTKQWESLRLVSEAYRFDKLNLAQLAALDVEITSDSALAGKYQQRYVDEVRKQVSNCEGVFRFEDGWKFTDEAFGIFVDALCQNAKIDKLVILCDLTPSQLNILSQKLKNNALRVQGIFWKSEQKFTNHDLRVLFEGLAENVTVKSFQFLNSMDNDELRLFTRAIEANQSLEEISLNASAFGVGEFQAFLQTLSRKPKITSLALTTLWDELVVELFNQLPQTAIQSLNIQFRDISEATSLAICQGIRSIPTLKRLDFPLRNMSEDAAKMLSQAFDEHPCLQSFVPVHSLRNLTG